MQDYIKISSSGNVDAATYYMYNFYYMLYNKLDSSIDGAVIEKLEVTSMNKAINKLKSYKLDTMSDLIDILKNSYDLIIEFNKIEDVSNLDTNVLQVYCDKIYGYMQEYFEFCKQVSF